jgi:hypothetical protein
MFIRDIMSSFDQIQSPLGSICVSFRSSLVLFMQSPDLFRLHIGESHNILLDLLKWPQRHIYPDNYSSTTHI